MRMGTPAARWVLLATVLGSGMAFLDGTIVNVALPTIAEDLGASLGDLQWVVNAYLVTLSAFVLLGGSLGDAHGRRRVFLLGVGLFTVASVGCGAAPSVSILIAARAVQGLGAALLVPGSLSLISAVFPEGERGRAIDRRTGRRGNVIDARRLIRRRRPRHDRRRIGRGLGLGRLGRAVASGDAEQDHGGSRRQTKRHLEIVPGPMRSKRHRGACVRRQQGAAISPPRDRHRSGLHRPGLLEPVPH
jgi:hypothetical protein